MKKTIADLVVYGKSYTAEKENNGICDVFAIKDGKYIYVGNKKGVKDYIEEGITKEIDNSNGLIIPGCTEGHAHFIGVDALVREMPGFYASYEELLEIIKEGMKQKEKINFFVSFGFNYLEFIVTHDLEKSYADELESIAPNIPIILLDNGGHQAICSATALKKAGMYDIKKVRGGEIKLTPKGIPNGIVTDEVVLYVTERALDLTTVEDEIYKIACNNAINILHKRGFTNFFDAYVNYLAGTEFYRYLKELDEQNKLTVNVTTSYTLRSYESDLYRDKIDFIIKEGKKYASKHFNPLCLKLFSDGVVEGRTGWLIDKYPNALPGKEHGNIIWKPEELINIVLYANQNNVPVHTHTFGDGACKATIDAYVNALKQTGNNIRNTLAHVRNITNDDIQRCADNNIIICENIIWHNELLPNDETYEKVLKERSSQLPEGIFENGYPMKSLIEKGITVSSSTDAPAAESVEGNILNIIEVAVTGIEPGQNRHVFNEKELLSIRQALDCLTINGAKQLAIDDKCGSIKVGKNADFVLLDNDFLDYKGEQLRTIHNTKIKKVFFEGKEVYSN